MALEPVGIRAVIEGLNQYLSGTRDMATSTANVGKAAGQVETASTKARGPLLALGSAFGTVAKIAAGFVVAKGLLELPGLFSRITGAASDLNESINAVQVIFGTSSERILAFGRNAAESVGLSARAFNELATPLGALLKNAGLPIGAVSDRTVELTQRASDLASVFNTDVSDALNAIQSALRGETEPIRRYGISLNEASIAAEAAALGLAGVTVNSNDVARASLDVEKAQKAYNDELSKNGPLTQAAREAQLDLKEAQEKLTKARQGDSAELTQGQKLQAAYSLIMKQSAAVQGDFANTATGAANRTRILQARQENLRAELGFKLLPLQIKFLELQNALTSVIANKVVPALDSFTRAVGPSAKAFGEFLQQIGTRALPILAGFGQALLSVIVPAVSAVASKISELAQMFAAGFSGATIGGQISDISQAAFNLGRIVSGVVGGIRDLGKAAGELFHLFEVGLSGGTIGGEFSQAERAAYEFGKVVREDVIPTVVAIAQFYAALAAEISKVVLAVAEFLKSSGIMETFGQGLLTIVQGIIKFASILADVLRPVFVFLRENETARVILAVVAAIALLVSGIGTIPVAVAAAILAIGFLRQHFEEITNFINRYVVGGIRTLVDAYLYMPRQLINVGTEIVETIVGGIERANDLLLGVPGKIVHWIMDGFVGYHKLLADIGLAIVEGVWSGIQDAKNYFLEKIGRFFSDAVDYVKDKLGIRSPSAEGEYIGEMFALGVQKGIQSGARGVQQANAKLIDDLRRLWNDNREPEAVFADVKQVTTAAGRPDLEQAFVRAYNELRTFARSQPAAFGQGTPQQQQAYLAEWNMRKDDLFRTIEAAAGGSGAAIGGFSQAVNTGTKSYSTAVGGMTTAVDKGSRAIVGTINGFTRAADGVIASLASLVARTPSSTGGGGGGGGGGSSSYTQPAPLSGTHVLSAGYALGKAPPRPAPATTTAAAPAPAPIMVTVNGTPSAELLALTHASVDQAFQQAQSQSVRQGALIPNGIG